jgi:lysophospholipase L1-like esterase
MKSFLQKSVFILAGLLIIQNVYAASLSQHIHPDDENIRYVGRFTDDYRFSWTGSVIEINLNGTDIAVLLDYQKGPAVGMTVVIDGKPSYLEVKKGTEEYIIGKRLKKGTHNIVLFRRSEGAKGAVQFKGFKLSKNSKLQTVEEPKRKILAIGDSITCGYGNEAPSVKEGNTIQNQNGYMSYAAIASRELEADVMMICWSGKGMYRNRQQNNDTKSTIPVIFDNVLSRDNNLKYDHTQFIPDVIAINLGTNDETELNGKKPPLNKDDYISAYKAFIVRLRTFAPDSKIVISIGPMGKFKKTYTDWMPEIAEAFKNVSVLFYEPFTGTEEKGGHHHPNVKKHVKMSDTLTAHIKEITGWK